MSKIQINDKVFLEPIESKYAEVIFKAIDDNRLFLRKWLPFIAQTNSVKDTQLFIRSILCKPQDKRDEIFMIWHYDTFVGLIGFKDTDRVNDKTELGYWMVEKMQGKGIMTQAVSKLLSHGFLKMKMNRIQIKVAVGNDKSAAIPKRLGLKFEGVERGGERIYDRYFDLEIYSLLKAEWLDL